MGEKNQDVDLPTIVGLPGARLRISQAGSRALHARSELGVRWNAEIGPEGSVAGRRQKEGTEQLLRLPALLAVGVGFLELPAG
jgi:hypothetical protein